MMNNAAEAVRRICDAIVETVNEADPVVGAPGGHIYAALAAGIGLRLDQYEQLMAALVRLGKVRREGECYFPAKRPTEVDDGMGGRYRPGAILTAEEG